MYERILIATDGSDCSARAIHEGVRVAKSSASLVTLLYVADDSTVVSDAGDPTPPNTCDARPTRRSTRGISSRASTA